MEYEKIVILIGDITGSPGIETLSENRRYLYKPPTKAEDPSQRWRGAPAVPASVSDRPIFRLRFGEDIFGPEGWKFGSASKDNGDEYDFQLLAARNTGISAVHFIIDFGADSNSPRLQVRSKNGVRVRIGDQEAAYYAQGEKVILSGRVKLDLGPIQMRVWSPRLLPNEQASFCISVQDFHAGFLNTQRSLVQNLSIPAPKRTELMRFGQNGTLYTTQHDVEPGTGGFGSVMKVRERRSNQIFAVKILHYDTEMSPAEIRRNRELLQTEFSQTVGLKHRNVVKVIELIFGILLHEPTWMVLEWVDFDLRDIDLEIDEMPFVFHEISNGLAYLHENGITHRDIKQENVLVGAAGTDGRRVVKLADFGTSKRNKNKSMGTLCGTNIYMAPEMYGSPYTNATDMWALGLLIVEQLNETDLMGTEKEVGAVEDSPFSQTQHCIWLALVLQPLVKDVPTDFAPLVGGLLEHDPAKRWKAAEARRWLIDAFAPTLDDLDDSEGQSDVQDKRDDANNCSDAEQPPNASKDKGKAKTDTVDCPQTAVKKSAVGRLPRNEHAWPPSPLLWNRALSQVQVPRRREENDRCPFCKSSAVFHSMYM